MKWHPLAGLRTTAPRLPRPRPRPRPRLHPLALPDAVPRIFSSLGRSDVEGGSDSALERSSHYYTTAYEDVLTMPAPGAFRIVVGKFGDADLKLFRGIGDQELTSARVIPVQ